MVKINPGLSESLDEYLILTGWPKVRPEDVSLKAELGNISLQYPFMTARMQCIVGPEMAVVAGRNGILTMIPRSLRDEDKQAIIDANNKVRLKKGDIEFQEDPEHVSPESSLEYVIKQVEKTGHSVVPITDNRFKLYGVYIHDPDNLPLVPPNTKITEVMHTLSLHPKKEKEIPYLVNTDNKEEIKKLLESQKRKFVPVVDKGEKRILQKIAFYQKFDTNYIGLAISTREHAEEEIEKFGGQVDTLCIDSSNACFNDAIRILKYAKQKFPDKPFGIGNIIQERDFRIFAKAGADYIIGGMGVGSICQTGSERGNGRGQFTVARELAGARDRFAKKGRYVPLVLDGSINKVKEMTVALAFADFIMMGNYFNRFHEAAGRKLNAGRKLTSEENLIEYVESWGEGHPIARLVALYGINFEEVLSKGVANQKASERYGHSTLSGSTIEGVVGIVEYRGWLKPCVERDIRYLRTTISNTGASDLESFRKEAKLERASPQTLRDMKPHDVEVTEEE